MAELVSKADEIRNKYPLSYALAMITVSEDIERVFRKIIAPGQRERTEGRTVGELVSKAAVLRIIFDSVGKPATEIYQKVRELPPAEAVTVVRCRECEHWETDWVPTHADEGERFCGHLGLVMKPDFMCAYGEPKKEGQDDV